MLRVTRHAPAPPSGLLSIIVPWALPAHPPPLTSDLLPVPTYQDDVSKMSPDQLKVVLEEYKTMHKECKALTQKMAELDGEAQEHQ